MFCKVRPLSVISMFAIILANMFLFSCSEHEDALDLPDTRIEISEAEINLGRVGRYYDVSVRSPERCVVECKADWVTLTSDTLAEDGILEFYAATNDGDNGRRAEIKVSYAGSPEQFVCISVYQCGWLDADDNALSGGELTQDFRVGWGYNILQDFMSENSLIAPILDYNKLLKYEAELGDNLIQEDNRSYEKIELYSGYSLDELSRTFTEAQEKEKSNLLGSKKTVSKFVKTNNYSTVVERCYGYSRLSKVVASRYLDEAGLLYLANEGKDIFSEAFNRQREKVKNDPTIENVDRLLKDFGTHIVISADLGGMIEYMVDFQKKEVTNVQTYTEMRTKYVYGKIQPSAETSRIDASISTDCKASKAFTIRAGENECVAKIRESIENFSNESQIDRQLLSDWLNSLEGDYRNDAELRKRLTIVGCTTLPVWIFFEPDLARLIRERVEEISKQSNYDYDKDIVQGDNCMIELNDWMLRFGDGDDATLVKVVYHGKMPVAEICHEYVPDIRADRRVTVMYPLVNGSPNLNHGIFLGDGEGNPPSYVAFEGGQVYVNPIEGMGLTDKITKLYYINGNLYLSDMNAGVSYGGITVEDAYCVLIDNVTDRLPFVKIGAGYWLRSNLKHSIYLGVYDNPDNPGSYHKVQQAFVGGIYYTNTLGRIKAGYLKINGNYIGTDKWFLPTTGDVFNLRDFVYKNAKVLFPGQPSGFNAEFSGFYGIYDVLHQDKYLGKYRQLYNGEYCFLACKDTDDSGTALVLSGDYTLSQVSLKASAKNYYPVRLFRSSNFKYTEKRW